jgi:hypothetical protein
MRARFKTCESSAFRREWLPPAASFYANEFSKISRQSHDWAMVRCCFHKPDRKPSLSVNLKGGGFVCFSCQAKGGSIIDFLMLRDGIDFTTAAKRLGAWWDQGLSESERSSLTEEKKERAREKQAAAELARRERQLRIRLREEIYNYERIQRQVSHRMNDPATPSAEIESCWAVLELVHEQMREATAAYCLLSFGSSATRAEFVENESWHDRPIRGVLDRGYVQDDAGHTVEVAA